MTITPESPAKTLTQLVGLEIRLELVRQDMNQADLARKIGKNEQWLSVRLRGRQPIDLNDLALIAHGLDKPVAELLPSEFRGPTVYAPNPGSVPISRMSVVRRPKRRKRHPINRPPAAPTRSVSPVHPSQRRPNPVRPGERRMAG